MNEFKRRSTSTGPDGFHHIGSLGNTQSRTSTPSVPYNTQASTATPSPYPPYNVSQQDGSVSDFKLIGAQHDPNDSFANYVRRSGQYGYQLQTLSDGSLYTPTSQKHQSGLSALGVEASTGGYFDRGPLDSGLPLSAGTRDLLAPLPSTHHTTPDHRRPSSASRGHHPSHLLPASTTFGAMSNHLYQADMDMDHMDSYDDDELLSAIPQDQSVYGDMGGYMGNQQGNKKDLKQIRRRSSKGAYRRPIFALRRIISLLL